MKKSSFVSAECAHVSREMSCYKCNKSVLYKAKRPSLSHSKTPVSTHPNCVIWRQT